MLLALASCGVHACSSSVLLFSSSPPPSNLPPLLLNPSNHHHPKHSYDLNWLEKLQGAKIKDGKLELATLTGGKQDDITVLVSVVEDGVTLGDE